MTSPPSSFDGLRVSIVGPCGIAPDGFSRPAELLSRSLRREGASVRQVDTDLPWLRRLPVLGRWLLPLVQTPLVLLRLLLAAPASDVVHVLAGSSWGFFLPLPLAWLLCRLWRRRAVLTCYGPHMARFVQRWQRLAWPILRRLDSCAVSSELLQEAFRRHGLEPTLAPCVLDMERFPFRAKSRWQPLLLWSGQLRPEANPTLAVRALAALHEQLPETRLLIVGDGPLASEISKLSRELGVAEAVSCRPRLALHRWRQAMQTASVLWSTAASDDLPAGLLAAAASGAVIVGTRHGAIGELVEDGVDGLLVEPYDHQALATATAQVLRRPILAEGLAHNARLASERYAWPEIRPAIAALYGRQAPQAALSARGEQASWENADVWPQTEFLWSEPVASAPAPAEPESGPTRSARRRR